MRLTRKQRKRRMADSATTQALGGFFSNPLSSVIGPAIGASLSAITPTVSADPAPEALHWTPPLAGPPVYPKGFRPKTIDILEQYPGSDSDMVRHYVRAEELGNKYGPLVSRAGIYAKEFFDLLGGPFKASRAGFSLDDILAAETALQGKTPQEAYDAGVYKHTEPGITGFGQGKWSDVKEKAQDLGLEVPFASKARGFLDIVTDPNRVGSALLDLYRGTTTQEQPFIPIRSPLDGYRTDDQTRFLDRTSSIRSPLDGFGSPIKDIPEGTFAPFQGQQIDWDLPAPKREDWFQDNPDAFTVTDRSEASLYPIGTTTGPIGGDSLLEDPTNIDNINTLLRNTLVPMEGITETVEPLPSGPEDMFRDWFPKGSIENQNTLLMNTLVPISTGSGMPVVTGPEDFEPVMPDLSIPFDPADESEVFGTFDSTTPGLIGDYLRAQEQDFIIPSGPEEMQPQPKKDTGGPSASDLRRLAEKSRKQAEEKEDRIRKEAKKLKVKVEHDDKKAIAQAKSRADKKKKEADSLQKAHDNFIKEQERLWRAKQQASMPKSWAFF